MSPHFLTTYASSRRSFAHFTRFIRCYNEQVALDLLRWNRSETHFLLVGRVFYSPLNNFRSVREPVHCVVATLGLMVRIVDTAGKVT